MNVRYPTFMDVYGSLKRISARTEIFCCLMQCTIINREETAGAEGSCRKKGKLLGDAIKTYPSVTVTYLPSNNTARFLPDIKPHKKRRRKIVFKRIAQGL